MKKYLVLVILYTCSVLNAAEPTVQERPAEVKKIMNETRNKLKKIIEEGKYDKKLIRKMKELKIEVDYIYNKKEAMFMPYIDKDGKRYWKQYGKKSDKQKKSKKSKIRKPTF